MSPEENSEAIEISFAFRTRVGPGIDLSHIADHFLRTLYCVHSTQYSFLVFVCVYYVMRAFDMHSGLIKDNLIAYFLTHGVFYPYV